MGVICTTGPETVSETDPWHPVRCPFRRRRRSPTKPGTPTTTTTRESHDPASLSENFPPVAPDDYDRKNESGENSAFAFENLIGLDADRDADAGHDAEEEDDNIHCISVLAGEFSEFSEKWVFVGRPDRDDGRRIVPRTSSLPTGPRPNSTWASVLLYPHENIPIPPNTIPIPTTTTTSPVSPSGCTSASQPQSFYSKTRSPTALLRFTRLIATFSPDPLLDSIPSPDSVQTDVVPNSSSNSFYPTAPPPLPRSVDFRGFYFQFVLLPELHVSTESVAYETLISRIGWEATRQRLDDQPSLERQQRDGDRGRNRRWVRDESRRKARKRLKAMLMEGFAELLHGEIGQAEKSVRAMLEICNSQHNVYVEDLELFVTDLLGRIRMEKREDGRRHCHRQLGQKKNDADTARALCFTQQLYQRVIKFQQEMRKKRSRRKKKFKKFRTKDEALVDDEAMELLLHLGSSSLIVRYAQALYDAAEYEKTIEIIGKHRLPQSHPERLNEHQRHYTNHPSETRLLILCLARLGAVQLAFDLLKTVSMQCEEWNKRIFMETEVELADVAWEVGDQVPFVVMFRERMEAIRPQPPCPYVRTLLTIIPRILKHDQVRTRTLRRRYVDLLYLASDFRAAIDQLDTYLSFCDVEEAQFEDFRLRAHLHLGFTTEPDRFRAAEVNFRIALLLAKAHTAESAEALVEYERIRTELEDLLEKEEYAPSERLAKLFWVDSHSFHWSTRLAVLQKDLLSQRPNDDLYFLIVLELGRRGFLNEREYYIGEATAKCPHRLKFWKYLGRPFHECRRKMVRCIDEYDDWLPPLVVLLMMGLEMNQSDTPEYGNLSTLCLDLFQYQTLYNHVIPRLLWPRALFLQDMDSASRHLQMGMTITCPEAEATSIELRLLKIEVDRRRKSCPPTLEADVEDVVKRSEDNDDVRERALALALKCELGCCAEEDLLKLTDLDPTLPMPFLRRTNLLVDEETQASLTEALKVIDRGLFYDLSPECLLSRARLLHRTLDDNFGARADLRLLLYLLPADSRGEIRKNAVTLLDSIRDTENSVEVDGEQEQ